MLLVYSPSIIPRSNSRRFSTVVAAMFPSASAVRNAWCGVTMTFGLDARSAKRKSQAPPTLAPTPHGQARLAAPLVEHGSPLGVQDVAGA